MEPKIRTAGDDERDAENNPQYQDRLTREREDGSTAHDRDRALDRCRIQPERFNARREFGPCLLNPFGLAHGRFLPLSFDSCV
jgi:hypothetical protein